MAQGLATAPQSAPTSPAVAPPPGNPRFPEVDSIRGIAILSVVVYHVCAVTGVLNRPIIGDLLIIAGSKAVPVFFATSGFLLYRPMARARARGRPVPSVARYARRRLLRILPAYWLALTVLGIYPGVSGVFTGDWWRLYFFLQIYSPRTSGMGLPVAWTLCVEATFYILLPVWALAMRRVRVGSGPRGWVGGELLGLAAIATIGVVFQILASRLIVSQLLAGTLLGNCSWFALGMALAVVSVDQAGRGNARRALELLGRFPGASLLAAAGCSAAASAVLHPGSLLGIVVSLDVRQPLGRTLGATALTAGICVFLLAPVVFGDLSRRTAARRLLSWRPLMWVGVVSYGVYLWHLEIVSLLGEHADRGFRATGLDLAHRVNVATTPVLFVLALALSVAVASISYRFVELPFLRLKER